MDTNIRMIIRLLYYMWIGRAQYFYSRPSFIDMHTGRGIQDELHISNRAGQLFTVLHSGRSLYSHGCDTRHGRDDEEQCEKIDDAALYEFKRNILRKYIIGQLQDETNNVLYKENLLEKYSFLFDFETKASNIESANKVEAPCMKKGGLLDDWEYHTFEESF